MQREEQTEFGPQSIAEAARAIEVDLYGYIVMLDPYFGLPVPDRLTPNTAGGPVWCFLRAVQHGKALLEGRGEYVTPSKLTALLWEEYNIARQDYAVTTVSPTPVDGLPQNPFNLDIIKEILANEQPTAKA